MNVLMFLKMFFTWDISVEDHKHNNNYYFSIWFAMISVFSFYLNKKLQEMPDNSVMKVK